jgi:hypothetical protein
MAIIMATKEPAQLPWKELGVEYVIESTGLFTDSDKPKGHIAAGKGDVKTLLIGIETGFMTTIHSCTAWSAMFRLSEGLLSPRGSLPSALSTGRDPGAGPQRNAQSPPAGSGLGRGIARTVADIVKVSSIRLRCPCRRLRG